MIAGPLDVLRLLTDGMQKLHDTRLALREAMKFNLVVYGSTPVPGVEGEMWCRILPPEPVYGRGR